MEVITLQPGTDIADAVKLVSKKRKAIMARPTNSVELNGTYWDGGSRDEYFLIHVASKKVTPLAGSAPAQFGGTTNTVKLEPGYMIIKAGVFMGKPSTPVVYLPPSE